MFENTYNLREDASSEPRWLVSVDIRLRISGSRAGGRAGRRQAAKYKGGGKKAQSGAAQVKSSSLGAGDH